MCSLTLLHQWSLAVLLLCFPMTLEGRQADAHTSRMRRSVSHTQLLHDKGRFIQEHRRRMWLEQLLEEVHTADQRGPHAHSQTQALTFSGTGLHQKPQGATKDHQERLDVDGVLPDLTQETNKEVAYKEQHLKGPSKRKKKPRLGRRRENEKRRRRARSALATAQNSA